MRIPVFSGPRCVELADPARVRVLRRAPNAEFVTRRKDNQVVQINLRQVDDESGLRARSGNPQAYVARIHTEGMPSGIFEFKSIAHQTEPMFRQVQTDCLSA